MKRCKYSFKCYKGDYRFSGELRWVNIVLIILFSSNDSVVSHTRYFGISLRVDSNGSVFTSKNPLTNKITPEFLWGISDLNLVNMNSISYQDFLSYVDRCELNERVEILDILKKYQKKFRIKFRNEEM